MGNLQSSFESSWLQGRLIYPFFKIKCLAKRRDIFVLCYCLFEFRYNLLELICRHHSRLSPFYLSIFEKNECRYALNLIGLRRHYPTLIITGIMSISSSSEASCSIGLMIPALVGVESSISISLLFNTPSISIRNLALNAISISAPS